MRLVHWGKVAGAVAGMATGQFWLALAGLVLGHQFDRGYASRREVEERDADGEQLPESFVMALFATMGHLAKADGRVTESEIRTVRILMHRLALGPAQVKAAIDRFESGKQSDFALAATLEPVKRYCATRPALRPLFVRLLLEVSLSKGTLDQRERTALWRVCSGLGVGRVELAQIEAILRAQRGFRGSARSERSPDRVQRAYDLLGVTRSASNDEIKKAYRRLMNCNHPDKLPGGDVAAVAAAQKRTREIRGAYDMLKALRAIR